MANIEHCSPPHILTPLHPPLISSLHVVPHSLTPSSLLPHPRAHILPSHPHYFTSLVLTPSQPPLILSLHHILATSHPPLISLTTCTCSSVTLPPPLISSLPHILTPSHPHSLTSSLPHILTLPSYMYPPSHPHCLISISSPHILILNTSYPHYLTSSLPHILTTSNPPSYSHPSPSHPPLILSLHLILATSPHIFSSSVTLPHILPSYPHSLTSSPHPHSITS